MLPISGSLHGYVYAKQPDTVETRHGQVHGELPCPQARGQGTAAELLLRQGLPPTGSRLEGEREGRCSDGGAAGCGGGSLNRESNFQRGRTEEVCGLAELPLPPDVLEAVGADRGGGVRHEDTIAVAERARENYQRSAIVRKIINRFPCRELYNSRL
ncbi:unnamed protein product [Musa textilis]